jgi:hypothetical protein
MGSWEVALMEIIPSKQEVEEMSDTLVRLVVFLAMVQDIFKERFWIKKKTRRSLYSSDTM